MNQEDVKTEKNDQFEKNLNKLTALLGGKTLFKKSKLPKDAVSNLVAELVTERKEEIAVEFKSKAKELLQKKVEFDREVKKMQEEMNKQIEAKKKEFVEKLNSLFNLVENIEEVEKSYYDSIKESSDK